MDRSLGTLDVIVGPGSSHCSPRILAYCTEPYTRALSCRMIVEGSGIAKPKGEAGEGTVIPGSRVGMGLAGFAIARALLNT